MIPTFNWKNYFQNCSLNIEDTTNLCRSNGISMSMKSTADAAVAGPAKFKCSPLLVRETSNCKQGASFGAGLKCNVKFWRNIPSIWRKMFFFNYLILIYICKTILPDSKCLSSTARIDWLDEACEMPLDSVLVWATGSKCVVAAAGIVVGRSRRFNFGISKGKSPKSTDVALSDVQCFWWWKFICYTIFDG